MFYFSDQLTGRPAIGPNGKVGSIQVQGNPLGEHRLYLKGWLHTRQRGPLLRGEDICGQAMLYGLLIGLQPDTGTPTAQCLPFLLVKYGPAAGCNDYA